MLKPKKFIRVVTALVLIALLWTSFLLIQGLFEQKISHHELYIPKNAESVLEINGEKLIRSFVQDLLVKKQLDAQLDATIRPSDSEPIGLDFLSTYYVFTIKEESKSLMGVLVNIFNEDQFTVAMGANPTDGTGFAVQNGVGLMLFDSGGNPMSSSKLNSIAKKIVGKESGFDLNKLPKLTESTSVRFWQNDYSFNEGMKSFSTICLSLSTVGNEMKMTGTANFESSVDRVYPVLRKSDLSIQSQFIPNAVNQFLKENLKDLGFNFPKLTYVSGNYHYSEPSPIKELKVLPNFDGIYAFDENLQVGIPLIALAASGKINTLNLKSFNIGDKKIYYKQIDPNTVYLGQSQYDPAPTQKNALLEVNGDLKQLLEIRNGGIVAKLLAMSPEYNAAESFLSEIKHSNFHVIDQDNKTVDILAEITFKDGKSALNEMILLLLKLGLFD